MVYDIDWDLSVACEWCLHSDHQKHGKECFWCSCPARSEADVKRLNDDLNSWFAAHNQRPAMAREMK